MSTEYFKIQPNSQSFIPKTPLSLILDKPTKSNPTNSSKIKKKTLHTHINKKKKANFYPYQIIILPLVQLISTAFWSLPRAYSKLLQPLFFAFFHIYIFSLLIEILVRVFWVCVSATKNGQYK